jgi:hypothetical protein
MSVSCQLCVVSDDTLAWLREDPRRLGTWEADEEDMLDIDKSWHAIHILLCGEGANDAPLPRGFLLGGAALDDGYAHEMGPPRVIDGEEMANIAALLADLGPEQLLARWDTATMETEDLYYLSAEPDVHGDYVATHYEQLRGFVARANERELGLVIRLR